MVPVALEAPAFRTKRLETKKKKEKRIQSKDSMSAYDWYMIVYDEKNKRRDTSTWAALMILN